MGCSTCMNSNGIPHGCGNNGVCGSGGCNKMNTFDWLADLGLHDPNPFEVVEVSFKNGARKDFYKNPFESRLITGDMVVVDTGNGYDVGLISLSGELVRLQMKKKKIPVDRTFNQVIRKANTRDIEKLEEARNLEKPALVKARVIARTLDLDMKIGDVEYQGDKRKATFYYTAEGRVDFRELVRHYAKDFRVKIEMRQIGSRQESARIGGIGSCGRELCCSTWLSDFRSVTTTSARYQNIAINQSKLSGQCGRLKCCLNYELDTYLEALDSFPRNANTLKTKKGNASLIKTDIFKGIMYYSYENLKPRGPIILIDKQQVKDILTMNAKGKFPESLHEFSLDKELLDDNKDKELEFADVTGQIELPKSQQRSNSSRRRRRRPKNNRNKGGARNRNQKKSGNSEKK